VPVRSLLTVLAIVVATLLAAFFAFVGYHKAFAPLAELAQHRVWTLALPEWAGRAVGWSELLLAAVLLGFALPRLRLWAAGAALLLIINQCVAAAVHWSSGEGDALPQNAVLVLLLGLVGLVAWLQQKPMGETS
jgi:hypothetical protein